MENRTMTATIGKRSSTGTALVCGLAAFLASAGSLRAAVPSQDGRASSSSQDSTAAVQQAPSEEESYVLQRGDEVTVKVFNLPELEDTLRIRPDGKISLTLVDDVQAAGLTTMELDGVLTRRFSEFYRDPQVTVIVREFANQKVYVAGEVERPGLVPLVGDLTALTAVLQAGGFKSSARTDNVILLRNGGNDQPVVTMLDLKDVIEHGKPDVALHSFDVIYVPMSRIAKVDQFVDNYIRRVLPITLSGGFTYLLNERIVAVPVR
jgi:protein involved in polysaccharide export with SLBB domain